MYEQLGCMYEQLGLADALFLSLPAIAVRTTLDVRAHHQEFDNLHGDEQGDGNQV